MKKESKKGDSFFLVYRGAEEIFLTMPSVSPPKGKICRRRDRSFISVRNSALDRHETNGALNLRLFIPRFASGDSVLVLIAADKKRYTYRYTMPKIYIK